MRLPFRYAKLDNALLLQVSSAARLRRHMTARGDVPSQTRARNDSQVPRQPSHVLGHVKCRISRRSEA